MSATIPDDEHADRDAEDPVEAEPVDPGVAERGVTCEVVDRQTVRHEQCQSADDVEHAQRRNERSDLESRDQDAVHHADEGAEPQVRAARPRDAGKSVTPRKLMGTPCKRNPAMTAREPEGGADGEIDAAVEDHHEHAHAEHA